VSAPEDGEVNSETRRMKSGQGLVNNARVKKKCCQKLVNICNRIITVVDQSTLTTYIIPILVTFLTINLLPFLGRNLKSPAFHQHLLSTK
jgi:hypothetical protein